MTPNILTKEMLTPEVLARFWSKVNKDGPIPAHRPELGPCWVWTGNRNKLGYGKFYLNGKKRFSHRVAYLIQKGEIPEDSPQIIHECDNPSCQRHIVSGTMLENILDRNLKGRQAKGNKNGRSTHPERTAKGEDAGLSKLRNEQVLEIVTLLNKGVKQSEIAAKFCISAPQISNILNGRTWQHLTGIKTPTRQEILARQAKTQRKNAKLNEKTVLEIRRRYADGKLLQRELAAEFGVDQTMIGLIIRRKTWKHV